MIIDFRNYRYLISIVAIGVIYAVTNGLYLHADKYVSPDSDELYEVKSPVWAIAVSFLAFFTGMILVAVFSMMRFYGNDSIDTSHLEAALLVAAAGLVLLIIACRWRIPYDDEQICVFRMFRKIRVIPFADLDQVTSDTANHVRLTQGGEHLITIKNTSDGYEAFVEALQAHGVIASQSLETEHAGKPGSDIQS